MPLSPPRANRCATRSTSCTLAARPAASYPGGTAGLAKTAPAEGQRYNAKSSEARLYARSLETQHDALLLSVGASDKKLYSYVHAMNGFAAVLTPGQASSLSKNPAVRRVWEDRRLPLDTNYSSNYLGLKTNVHQQLIQGDGVIIGVIDTVRPASVSIRVRRLFGPPRASWNGTCQAGEGWSSDDCNNKLIGARWFAAGFLAASEIADGEFLSPRDSDGHGTHVATIAAGNEFVRAYLEGQAIPSWVTGMAPRAQLAVYKACYRAPGELQAGCAMTDTIAATDAAVADGVDVINFSIGTDP